MLSKESLMSNFKNGQQVSGRFYSYFFEQQAFAGIVKKGYDGVTNTHWFYIHPYNVPDRVSICVGEIVSMSLIEANN